jgi:tetratricopeptide (TPR) repeat protein
VRAALVANAGVFAATLVVFVDALILLADGKSAPVHAALIVWMLFLGAVFVAALGAYDAHRVTRDQRASVEITTLGRLDRIAALLHDGKIEDLGTRLHELRETFPDWGLLAELESYVDLRLGNPARGLARVERLLAGSDDLYVTPVVGVACALAAGDEDAASDLLAHIPEGSGAARHVRLLQQAVGLRRAHLDSLLGRDARLAHAPSPGSRTAASPRLLGGIAERLPISKAALSLDLAPADVPETASLLELLERWYDSSDPAALRAFIRGSMLDLLLDYVWSSEGERKNAAALLLESARAAHDPLVLETCGFVFLALGGYADAIRSLEQALRMLPSAARCHWGLALAYDRLGWAEAAHTALRRAETLEWSPAIVGLTERFLSPGRLAGEDTVKARLYFFRNGAESLDRFVAALLGVTPEDVPATRQSLRDRFLDALVTPIAERAGPTVTG